MVSPGWYRSKENMTIEREEKVVKFRYIGRANGEEDTLAEKVSFQLYRTDK